MKPNFALDLSLESIRLLHRTEIGWMCVGDVSLDDPELGDRLAVLRRTASGLEISGVTTKLVIPNSQVLYIELHAPGPSAEDRIAQIRRCLEGKTPYRVTDLVFDWCGDGQSVQVAVVYRQSLREAEALAVQHGFNPLSFVAVPEPNSFDGEPFFGPTKHSESLLKHGDTVERDGERMALIGSGNLLDSFAKTLERSNGIDPRAESFTPSPESSTRHRQPVKENEPFGSSAYVDTGQFQHHAVVSRQVSVSGGGTAPVIATDSEVHLGNPVNSKLVAGPEETPDPSGQVEPSEVKHGRSSGRSRRNPHSIQSSHREEPVPASTTASLQDDHLENGSPNSDSRYWIKKAVILLNILVLIIAICLGLERWLSSKQIEASSSRYWPYEGSQATIDINLKPIQLEEENLRSRGLEDFINRPVRSTTGISDSKVLTADLQHTPSGPDQDRSPAPVFASLTGLTKDAILRNDPPETVRNPPPNLSENEISDLDTGNWQPDPVQPDGTVDHNRMERIHAALVDRIAPPLFEAEKPRRELTEERNDLTETVRTTPPNLNQSEISDLGTGFSQLDPVQPAGTTGHSRMGKVHVALADRVDLPHHKPEMPGGELRGGDLKLSLVPKPEITGPSGASWPTAVNTVHVESRDRHLTAAVQPEGTAQVSSATASESPSVSPVAVSSEILPKTRADTRSATAPDDGDQLQSPDPGTVAGLVARPPALRPEIPEDVSKLAVKVSPRPIARPEDRPRVIQTDRNPSAGGRSEPATLNGERRTASQRNARTAATGITVAGLATESDAIRLRRINLIGTFGSSTDRYALVRLRSGRFVQGLKVGDRLDGGRVTAIGDDDLLYVKNGRSIRLQLPTE